MDGTLTNPGDDAAMAMLERDVLISRIVDGECSEGAWERFSAIASGDAGAWRELAIAQRQNARLSIEVERALDVASEIDLPSADVWGAGSRGRSKHGRTVGLGRWGGWAAAAMVTMAWVGAMFSHVGPNTSSNQNVAGFVPDASYQPKNHQEAIDAYLQVGRKSGNVIGEIPKWVLVERKPASSGKGLSLIHI